ncbi:MAG: 5-(carboxyamino)imidazole ribonucleotide mutase [bacterium]
MDKSKPLVGILMGSPSDIPVMEEASRVLDQLGVPWEAHICSAHRSPGKALAYAAGAAARGLDVLIAGAGWAAHLAGFVAAQTPLPVIGVPIDSSPLKGIDALLATVQMPPGVPVATMAIGKGGARNAGVLAAQILSTKYPELRERIVRFKGDMAAEVESKDQELQASRGSRDDRKR